MNMGAGAACARARLLQMIEHLVRSIDIQMRTQQSHRFGLKASQDEHRAIVAACRPRIWVYCGDRDYCGWGG